MRICIELKAREGGGVLFLYGLEHLDMKLPGGLAQGGHFALGFVRFESRHVTDILKWLVSELRRCAYIS